MRKKINVSGVISLGAVGYEVFHDSNVKSSNVSDAAMGAISFVPGWGWIAGGIYFGADIVTKLSTGKSIGEHLDAAIEERYDSVPHKASHQNNTFIPRAMPWAKNFWAFSPFQPYS